MPRLTAGTRLIASNRQTASNRDASLPQNYEINAGTLFEDFETIGEWTEAGTGSIAVDTSNFKTGTQGIKVTTASGTSKSIIKTISLNPIATGVWGFWFYVYDLTTLLSVQINLSSDTSFTNRFVRTINDEYLRKGWNFVSIGRGSISNENSWGTSGTIAWTDTMIRIKWVVNSQAATICNVTFDSIYYGLYSKPKIIIMFDDGWDTQYSAAYNYMATKGVKGSIMVIKDKVGTAGYCTTAQLLEMYNAGWDLGTHGLTDLSTLGTQTEQETEISYNEGYLTSQGFIRNNCHKHYAFPNGGYNNNAISALEALGYKTARTILARLQDVNKGIDNPLLLTTRLLGGTGVTLANAQGYVGTAIANGGTFIFYGHKIVSGVEANTNEWQDTKFNSLIDYIYLKSLGGQLDVVTISEWYNGLTNPRKII